MQSVSQSCHEEISRVAGAEFCKNSDPENVPFSGPVFM
ncbi:hypothetical protein SPO1350 [Ruegeria pomeroyi DSS-3]|uniref:Uncharacterized protein n=1 Tax=Ruegeria pomeroyi (strain ATCC 700808 / DSM 15171 / DSS-3) TaxID=246200 RepID=Q5LTR3_RUEPO|nr:hypothetical protein SPO1350 [Ruegeria pomeroyi DSS-3]